MLILAVIGAVGFFLGALLWVEQAPSPSRFVAPYSGNELVDAVMAMGLLAFLFHVYRARSMSFYHRLQESKERLRAMASTDVLTGLLKAPCLLRALRSVLACHAAQALTVCSAVHRSGPLQGH